MPKYQSMGLRSAARARLELRENIARIVESIAFVIGIESRQRAVSDGRRQREEGKHPRRTSKKASAVDLGMPAHAGRQYRRRCPCSGRLEMDSLSAVRLVMADLKQSAREIEDLGVELRRFTRLLIDCRLLPIEGGPETEMIRERPITTTNQLGFCKK